MIRSALTFLACVGLAVAAVLAALLGCAVFVTRMSAPVDVTPVSSTDRSVSVRRPPGAARPRSRGPSPRSRTG